MTRIPRGAATLLVSTSALLAGALPCAGEEPRLVVEVEGLAFEGGEIELSIEMRRSLADQHVTFTVTVDGEQVDRFNARGPRASHRFAHPLLTAGRHEIGIRTGTEWAQIAVRVLPRWMPWAVGAALVAVALFVVLLVRRAKRTGASGAR